MATPPSEALLTVRSALIIFGAIVAGVIAGVLSSLAQASVPAACLVGGGAFVAVLALLNTIIGRGREHR